MDWLTATRRAAERARMAGALAAIDTRVETLPEQGIDYVVRVLSNVRRKRQASAAKPADPFAPPYERALVVGDLSPTHLILLNKFPVLDAHVLAVTREYEPQTHVLTVADCDALLRLLQDWDGLAFYNGGAQAGASQPHKHMQMIALTPTSAEQGLPVAAALAAGNPGCSMGQSPRLPFPHARVRMPALAWQNPAIGATVVHTLYLELLRAVGLPPDGVQQPGPYNLLATRDWLWLVPRCRQSCEGIEVNALGFAGTLLVADEAHLATLKAMGPAACLRAVCALSSTTG